MSIHQFKRLLVIFIVICSLVDSQKVFAQTVKPYKFGFTIDQQQHRFEKRDERGIVMGEFGFITADGIYHVTVYATDEQGRFRILAMRNYPYESPPKTIEMTMVQQKPLVTTKPMTVTAVIADTKKMLKKFNFHTKACSGCFVKKFEPEETPDEPVVNKISEIRPLSKPLLPVLPKQKTTVKPGTTKAQFQIQKLQNTPPHNHNTTPKTQQYTTRRSQVQQLTAAASSPAGQTIKTSTVPTTIRNLKPTNTFTQSSPIRTSNKSINIAPKTTTRAAIIPTPSKDINPSIAVQTPGLPPVASIGSSGGPTNDNSRPVSEAPPTIAPSTGKTLKTSTALPNLPKENSINIDNRSKGPAGSAISSGTENAVGTSNGIGDLYRFKYILDYNGHTETGARNGNKVGNYFVVGDDNVERTVEYIANEFGYQPRIRWRKLDTAQKSKENTLKDYEFVWFKE